MSSDPANSSQSVHNKGSVLATFRDAFCNAAGDEQGALLRSAVRELAQLIEENGQKENSSIDREAGLAARLAEIETENAGLSLRIRQQEVDLESRSGELEIERKRSAKLQNLANEIQGQADSRATKIDRLEAAVREKDAQLEDLQVRLSEMNERLESGLADSELRQRVSLLETNLTAANRNNEELKVRYKSMLDEKDAELKASADQIDALRQQSSAAKNQSINIYWKKFCANAKWASGLAEIAPESGLPSIQEGYLTLARFTIDLDRTFKIRLLEPAKMNDTLADRMRNYRNNESMDQILSSALAQPMMARRVSTRLRILQSYLIGAMQAGYPAMMSIRQELDKHLLTSEEGAKVDPRRTIKAYIRDQGPDFFQQRMRGVYAKKIEKCINAELEAKQ